MRKKQKCRSASSIQVKDASDTEIALRLCLDLGRKNILILGATGNRIDHIWANVQCLKIGLDAGADDYITKPFSLMVLRCKSVCAA